MHAELVKLVENHLNPQGTGRSVWQTSKTVFIK